MKQVYMTAEDLIKLPVHSLRNKRWQTPYAVYDKDASEVLKAFSDREDIEDQNLEMSIATLGVNVPVIIDEDNNIVDGLRRIHAAFKFDKTQHIPVHVCKNEDVQLILINSVMQVKSLTKFQRLFLIYPFVKDAANQLVALLEKGKTSNLKHVNSSRVQSLQSRENIEFIGDSVVYFNDGKRVVQLTKLDDLAQQLNVSSRYLSYCKGVYDAIDKTDSKEVAQLIAHRCVFIDGTPIERIASAVAGSFSERNLEDEANKPFSELISKVDKALDTLLVRVGKDEILQQPEVIEKLDKSFENFALKLNPQLRDILSKKLRQAAQIGTAK